MTRAQVSCDVKQICALRSKAVDCALCPPELEQLSVTLELYAAVSVPVPLPAETPALASQSQAGFDPDIPRRPPFKAYISNISYDIQPEHIEDLFRGLQVCKQSSVLFAVQLLVPHVHEEGIEKVLMLQCRSGMCSLSCTGTPSGRRECSLSLQPQMSSRMLCRQPAQ